MYFSKNNCHVDLPHCRVSLKSANIPIFPRPSVPSRCSISMQLVSRTHAIQEAGNNEREVIWLADLAIIRDSRRFVFRCTVRSRLPVRNRQVEDPRATKKRDHRRILGFRRAAPIRVLRGRKVMARKKEREKESSLSLVRKVTREGTDPLSECYTLLQLKSGISTGV